MAISMPMTSQREGVVDFTVPIHSSGVSVLYNSPSVRPDSPDLRLGRFVEPLSPLVWLLLCITAVTASATVYISERLSSPYNSSSSMGGGSRGFTILDSLSFSLMAMLMLSTAPEASPRSMAGRLAALALRFFSLFLVLSYAGNLAAVLTAVRRDQQRPITLESLLHEGASSVRFTTIHNTDTSVWLENSDDPSIRHIWQIITDSDSFVETPIKGIEATRQGVPLSGSSVAFVWDSTSINHDVMTDCNLETIPLAVNIRQFAIALPRGAVYRSQLNTAILELHEQGTITALQNKWWSSPRQCHSAPTDTSLGVSDLAGLFVVFLVLLVTSLVTSVITCFRSQRHVTSSQRRVSLKQFKAVENCRNKGSSPPPSSSDLHQNIQPATSILQLDEPSLTNSKRSCSTTTTTTYRQTNIF